MYIQYSSLQRRSWWRLSHNGIFVAIAALLNVIQNLVYDYLFLGFKIPKGEPLVEIMSDLNEGIFAWVTVNFLLNRLEDLGQQHNPPGWLNIPCCCLGHGQLSPPHLGQSYHSISRFWAWVTVNFLINRLVTQVGLVHDQNRGNVHQNTGSGSHVLSARGKARGGEQKKIDGRRGQLKNI